MKGKFKILVFIIEFKFKILSTRDEEEFNAVVNNNNSESKFKTRQLQQTVLLKYKLHEEEINTNLREKRLAFQKSVKLCKEKQEELLRRQQEVLNLKVWILKNKQKLQIFFVVDRMNIELNNLKNLLMKKRIKEKELYKNIKQNWN